MQFPVIKLDLHPLDFFVFDYWIGVIFYKKLRKFHFFLLLLIYFYILPKTQKIGLSAWNNLFTLDVASCDFNHHIKFNSLRHCRAIYR
jgi:hypothetical protein